MKPADGRGIEAASIARSPETSIVDVEPLSGGRFAATVRISVEDATLRAELDRAISDALRAAISTDIEDDPRVVRLRTKKRFERLGAEGVTRAIVVVRVTESNARRLPDLVERIRAAGALGVQLVWDGESPQRAHVERHVFAVLEQARATPGGPPVVVATAEEPAFSLRVLIAHQIRRASAEGRRPIVRDSASLPERMVGAEPQIRKIEGRS